MVNETARTRNTNSAARSKGSRGSPRTFPPPPPLPFGIRILMAKLFDSTPGLYSDEAFGKKV